MEKPAKRTVAIPAGHGFKTRPMEFYHPTEVDAYIAHLEQRAEAAEAKYSEVSDWYAKMKTRMLVAEAELKAIKERGNG